MGLEARIGALRLRFGPRADIWASGLETRIRALKLRFKGEGNGEEAEEGGAAAQKGINGPTNQPTK